MGTRKSEEHRITGYIVVKAQFKVVSPMRIGSGRQVQSDVDIVRGADGNAYLPGSSIIGALSQSCNRFLDGSKDVDLLIAAEILWGTTMSPQNAQKQDSYQSHLRLSDIPLEGKDNHITIRDGVAISHSENTALDKKKYNYELLESEQEFTFQPEITIRRGFDPNVVARLQELVGHMLHVLADDFRVGGLTTRGFGCLELVGECKVRWFDFVGGTEEDRQQHRADWFKYLNGEGFEALPNSTWKSIAPTPTASKLQICASFKVKGALITGASARPNDDSDKVQLSLKNGNYVISGKSWAGALRHRAFKILKTLSISEEESRINKLFGMVDEKHKTQIKSRLITTESIIPKADAKPMHQNRIRVDRFTGGVIKGGLFNSTPIWQSNVVMNLAIHDFQDWEAALLLHVLKDLWVGDLAIGGEKNVGRGVLEGIEATIDFGEGDKMTIKKGQGDEVTVTKEKDAAARLEALEAEFKSLIPQTQKKQ